MFEYIKNRKNFVVAEIGVAEGNNALEILRGLDISKLYLIDPYLPYFEDGYLQKQVFFNKKIAKEKLKIYSDKTVFIYKKSKRASNMFNDGFFDAVYIDGDHRQEQVYNDIKSWYPKVKPGGVIGGHDFNDYHGGVILGVMQYLDENQLVLTDTRADDWWIEK